VEPRKANGSHNGCRRKRSLLDKKAIFDMFSGSDGGKEFCGSAESMWWGYNSLGGERQLKGQKAKW